MSGPESVDQGKGRQIEKRPRREAHPVPTHHRPELRARGLRAAGLPHLCIYDLRTTAITWSVESGIDLGTVADVTGTSIAMLSQTYVRPTKTSLRAAMAAIDGREVVGQ